MLFSSDSYLSVCSSSSSSSSSSSRMMPVLGFVVVVPDTDTAGTDDTADTAVVEHSFDARRGMR